MRTVEEVAACCPFLKFTDRGQERLGEILVFLERLEADEVPLAARARSEFEEGLQYLNDFGGQVSDQDERRRFEVTLGADGHPQCFTITWRMLREDTGEYVHSMDGGFIWHGGPSDPFVVSLEPDMLWGIHT